MLLSDDTRQIFNVSEVHSGTIVYARRKEWHEGITGIVMETSAERLRIQFLPLVQNVVNHCFVPASEVAAGLWELRYSNDGLATVKTWPVQDTEEGADG